MKLLHRFFSSEASGGVLLIIAAAAAMVLANLGITRDLYHAFLETPVELKVGALEINKNMLLWINDALMAVFFLLVGLEVKRELVLGSLASRQRAAFPVIAALGGMVVPRCSSPAFTAGSGCTSRLGDPGRDGYCLCARGAGLAGKPRAGCAENLPDGAGDHR